MKKNINVLIQFIAAAIWADGEYQAEEKGMLKEFEDALGLPIAEVEAVVNKFGTLNEEQIAETLEQAAKGIDPNDAKSILDVTLQFIIADGVVTIDELSNFYVFAEILGISEADANEMFDNVVDEYDDLIIEDAE